MLEVECICCGAELPGRQVHPRPVTKSMCERCTREVKRMQLALEIVQQEQQPVAIH
jgi:hypothetical protein